MRANDSWRRRWAEAWRALGAGDDRAMAREALLDALLARYDEPQRRYHTRRHLEEGFERFDRARGRAEHPGEVAVALFYHDAVYDPRASDNEARSADLARAALEAHAIAPEVIARVEALILATRHEVPPPTPDAALLVDVDLGILAAPVERFDEYEREVREEFAWVPGILFRRTRRRILEGFLARPRIYTSGAFGADEAAARANLTRSLARL